MGLLNREISDLQLFAYAMGATDAMPTISDASAVRRFMKRFGHLCEDCTEKALMDRLTRMRAEYLDTLRTKPEQP